LRFGNDLRWDDSNCDNTEYSICELDEKEGCGSPEWSTDNFCMIKTIKLAAIMMVEHAVTILLIYGTSIAKTVNV